MPGKRRFQVLIVKVKPSGRKEFKLVSPARALILSSQHWRRVVTEAERQEAKEWLAAKAAGESERPRTKSGTFGPLK